MSPFFLYTPDTTFYKIMCTYQTVQFVICRKVWFFRFCLEMKEKVNNKDYYLKIDYYMYVIANDIWYMIYDVRSKIVDSYICMAIT